VSALLFFLRVMKISSRRKIMRARKNFAHVVIFFFAYENFFA
jgi:hypothetical protein